MGRFTYLYQLTTWKKLRRAHLRRNPFCVKCMECGLLVPGNTVDHKKPHKGNMELFVDAGNLQTLCHTHHSKDKQIEERYGHAPGAGEDGLPIDPNHPWNSVKNVSSEGGLQSRDHRGGGVDQK